MTKRIKSAFSIMLSFIMFFYAAPGAYAQVNVSKLPAGNSEGRLIEEGMSVRIGNYETLDAENTETFTDGAVLADGFFFSAAEILTYKDAADITGESDSITLTTPDSNQTETGTRMLDGTNNTIEFEWGTEKTVKRFEIWVWPVGAIKDYEIQYHNGTSWEICSAGTFDQTQPVPAEDAKNYAGKRTVSYITNFDPVSTKKLRFVAKTFKEGYSSAKIAEAIPRNSNNVNLLATYSMTHNYASTGWLDAKGGNTDAGYNTRASQYALDFGCSKVDDRTDWLYCYNDGSLKHASPVQGNWPYSPCAVSADSSNGLWYAVRLTDSPQKINKAAFTVKSGAVRKFEIWYNTAVSAEIGSKKPAPSGETWKKAITVSGNFEKDNVAEAYIPNTVAAEYWMIKVTDFDAGTKFGTISVCVLAENEVADIAAAAAYAVDNLQTDTENNDEASERIDNLSESFLYNGNEYNVLWESSDTSLADVSQGNTAYIAFHKEEESVTLTAKVSLSGDDSKYYILSKSFKLLARENEYGVKAGSGAQFENGTDASLLTDGFFFSAYDKEVNGNILPTESPERFAKFENNSVDDNYIEYKWSEKDKVRRMDLWVWPAGAIGEYAIETSEDGAAWTEHSSGSADENVLPDGNAEFNGQAVYYPILFDEVNTKYLRFRIKSFGEGFSAAYISEAVLKRNNNTNFVQAPDNAAGAYFGHSHFMGSYTASNTTDSNPIYRKSSKAVWPVLPDSTSVQISANGTSAWYAAAFNTLPVKINRVTVPLEDGSATEIELLCAAGEASGFDMQSDYPTPPDTNAEWKTVATVRGNFSSTNSAVIDITNAQTSKYWMVRVKNAASGLKLGRIGLYTVSDGETSDLTAASDRVFGNLKTDYGLGADTAKTKISFFNKYSYNEKEYSVKWESNSAFLDIATGNISEHETDESIILTAIVTDPGNSGISYCISKRFLLKAKLSVSIFDEEMNISSGSILTDGFTYCAYDRSQLPAPKNAFYNKDKFVKFDSVNSGVEFYWDTPKVIKRAEMWVWPADAVSDYEILVSADGVNWTTHYSGTIKDQYAQNPAARPADTSDAAGRSNFYPIVFDKPTGSYNYFRFVIKGFRDEETGAYIAEMKFKETNEVDYLGLNTIKGTENSSNSSASIYTADYYLSDTTSSIIRRRNDIIIWPIYSTGSTSGINLKPREGDLCWYATTFQGAGVAINKATLKIEKGTVYEYEVMCADGESGYKWTDYPPRPDTVKDWTTVARVSGQFTKSNPSAIHFDNGMASKYWMIKVTQASSDLQISRIGLYTLGKYELNKSSFVKERVFDNVSDTDIDNVIKEKMNIPSKITVDGKQYEVFWLYDDSMIKADGTVIPSKNDREMLLTANVGSAAENYKHVLKKTYYLAAKNDGAKTVLYDEGNIVLNKTEEKMCSVELENGFIYSGKKETEIKFGAENNGKIQFLSDKGTLLDVVAESDSIIVNKGTGNEIVVPFSERIRIDIENDSFSLYKLGGTTDQIMIYHKKLLLNRPLTAVKLSANEDTSMKLETFTVKAYSKDLFNAVKEQFDFSKISPEYKAADLNGNLTLLDKTADIRFSYEFGNTDIIIAEDTQNGKIGKVNLTAPGETTVTVNAVSEASADLSFSKTFKVLTGKKNVAADAVSSSPAAAVGDKTANMAADGSLESEFVTNAGKYRINIDLGETKGFNKLRIYEAETTAKITEYNVLASSNNVDYQKIYSGGTITSGEYIDTDYNEARFIRIEVTAVSGSGTGIKEMCAYNEMSDGDKLLYDYNALIQNLTVADGAIIPKTGKFGTSFTISADNSIISVEETSDKANWIIKAAKSSKETVVNVTLNAVNAAATPISKSYQITVLADTDIRNNGISSGSNTGSGGGGGNRISSSSVAFTQDTEKAQNAYAENELTNHWGANEIKTLISRRIVQGDGRSLNLKENVTRAEFCKMIVTGLGYELIPYRKTFYDVKDSDWFAAFAETAFEHGIMIGNENGFRGNDIISREEMAVVILNALKAQLLNVASENTVSFNDSESISIWAKEAVKLCAALGILKGYDDGDFKPEKALQRDEAMVVICRVLSQVGK